MCGRRVAEVVVLDLGVGLGAGLVRVGGADAWDDELQAAATSAKPSVIKRTRRTRPECGAHRTPGQ